MNLTYQNYSLKYKLKPPCVGNPTDIKSPKFIYWFLGSEERQGTFNKSQPLLVVFSICLFIWIFNIVFFSGAEERQLHRQSIPTLPWGLHILRPGQQWLCEYPSNVYSVLWVSSGFLVKDNNGYVSIQSMCILVSFCSCWGLEIFRQIK